MCFFLPLRCLKLLAFIGCGLLLGVCGALIWLGFFLKDQEVVKTITDYSHEIFLILVIAGAFLGLVFLIGCFGTWKKNSCCLGIFVILNFLIGATVVLLGVGLIYARHTIDNELGTTEKCLDNFEDADSAVVSAESYFCHFECACTMNDETKKETNYSKEVITGSAKSMLKCEPCETLENYDGSNADYVKGAVLDWLKENVNPKINKANCKEYASSDDMLDYYFTDDEQKYLSLLTWVEKQFSCSGLCSAQKIYLFSDVNHGVPKGSCYTQLRNWIKEHFLTYAIVFISIGSYMLLMVFVSCGLCCKKPEGSSYKNESLEARFQKVNEKTQRFLN